MKITGYVTALNRTPALIPIPSFVFVRASFFVSSRRMSVSVAGLECDARRPISLLLLALSCPALQLS